MVNGTFRMLGIAGSLREGSYNRALIHNAQELAPGGVEIEVFDRLGEIPLFSEDVEAQGDPEPVRDLKRRIEEADALLIATPEYNYSVPGVLKNAIDWASRPAPNSVLREKPIGLMGASVSQFGTVRAQQSLRQSFVFTESHALLKPEVLIGNASERFDAQGNLTDEASRSFVGELLDALVAWTDRVQRPTAAAANW